MRNQSQNANVVRVSLGWPFHALMFAWSIGIGFACGLLHVPPLVVVGVLLVLNITVSRKVLTNKVKKVQKQLDMHYNIHQQASR